MIHSDAAEAISPFSIISPIDAYYAFASHATFSPLITPFSS
jgi:hypothetical protein